MSLPIFSLNGDSGYAGISSQGFYAYDDFNKKLIEVSHDSGDIGDDAEFSVKEFGIVVTEVESFPSVQPLMHTLTMEFQEPPSGDGGMGMPIYDLDGSEGITGISPAEAGYYAYDATSEKLIEVEVVSGTVGTGAVFEAVESGLVVSNVTTAPGVTAEAEKYTPPANDGGPGDGGGQVVTVLPDLSIFEIVAGDAVPGVTTENAGYYAYDGSSEKIYEVVKTGGSNGVDTDDHYMYVSGGEVIDVSSYNGNFFDTTDITEVIANPAAIYSDNHDDQQLFEIVRVPGERYGEIVTYAIKMVDDLTTTTDTSEKTFKSLTFNVGWDYGEHKFWGQLLPGGNAPADMWTVYEVTSTEVTSLAAAAKFALDPNNLKLHEVTLSGDTYVYANSAAIDVSQAEITAIQAKSDLGGISPNSFPLTMENEDEFVNDPMNNTISIGMVDAGGITFTEGDTIAEFMLTKETSDAFTGLNLTTAQYKLDGDDVTTPASNALPARADGIHFGYDFSAHALKTFLETTRGEEVPNVELLVTDKATSDGLSLVPVAKMGNLIKYEVVLNTPVPLYLAGEDVVANQSITITGAKILEESLIWRTDTSYTTAETASLLSGGGFSKAAAFDMTDFTTAETAGKSYTGFEFFDLIEAATDHENTNANFSDLKHATTLTLDFEGFDTPDIEALKVNPKDVEARYVLAEFVALDNGSEDDFMANDNSKAIEYTAKKGTETLATRTVYRHKDGEYGAGDAAKDTGLSKVIADGSEVTVLGDGVYVNELAYNDAVGAEDALAALVIAQDAITDQVTANNTYTAQQMISADFDGNGKVETKDAYEILRHSVYGPEEGEPMAEWIYIDNLSSSDVKVNDVSYDPVVDEFVGQPTDLNLTAVLRGDVTSSYNGPAPAGGKIYVDGTGYVDIGFESTFEMFTAFAENLIENSVYDTVFAIESDGIVTATSEDETIILLSDSGHIKIKGASAADQIGLDVDSLEVATPSAILIADQANNIKYGGSNELESAPTLDDIIAKLNSGLSTILGDEQYVSVVYVFDETAAASTDPSSTIIGIDANENGKIDVQKELVLELDDAFNLSELAGMLKADPTDPDHFILDVMSSMTM